MHPISTTNHQLRVCVCGQPFKPNIGGVRSGRSGNLSTTGVMEAIEKAIKGRAQVPELITEMAGDVVSREEFTKVVEELMIRLDALGTSADTPTPAAKKASEKPAKSKAADPAAEVK
jgi:BMFP domain-containing protein YqiC